MLEETRDDGKPVVENVGLIAHSRLPIDGHSFTMAPGQLKAGRLNSRLRINETASPKRDTFDWYGGQRRGPTRWKETRFCSAACPAPRNLRRRSAPRPARRVCSSSTSANRDRQTGQARTGLVQGSCCAYHCRGLLRSLKDARHRRCGWKNQDLGRENRGGSVRIKRFSVQVTKRAAAPVSVTGATWTPRRTSGGLPRPDRDRPDPCGCLDTFRGRSDRGPADRRRGSTRGALCSWARSETSTSFRSSMVERCADRVMT